MQTKKNNRKLTLLKTFLLIITAGIFLVSCQPADFQTRLDSLTGVEITEVPESLTPKEIREQYKVTIDTSFKRNFELYFTQPIDHNNPEGETFKQRVILSHVGLDRPVVVIIEGYGIWSGREHELTKALNANQVVIEHRFFENSMPDSIPWSMLNIEQAANDQHKVIQAIKKIYPGKILTTGISKGGQTTMYHKRFFPEDVDVAVPYVAPLNFSNEDPRVYEFLNSVGSDVCRQKLYDYQIALFKNKDKMMPRVKAVAEERGYEFIMGIERAYDLGVLELPFAFWQWGTSCSLIPDADAPIDTLYKFWRTVNPITFFEEKGIENQRSFFWQAMTEIGMYGYEVEPFKEYLEDTGNITFDFTMPKGVEWEFNPKPMKEVHEFLEEHGNNMMFIYGEYDAWSSTAYVPKSGKTNAVSFFKPGGDHGSRIRNFPEEMQDEIYSILAKWMETEIIRD